MGEITKISILLDGSVDEQTTEELRAPVVQQGSSPPLAVSRNTRLSLRKGTCTRAPAVTARGVSLGATSPAYGIVGAARTRRMAVYTTPDRGNRETPEDGASTPGSGVIRSQRDEPGGRQNAYMPLQMTSAGALPGVSAVSGVSSAYNETLDELWVVWTTTIREDSESARVYFEVFSGEGTLLVSATALRDSTGIAAKVGVTAHGANGTCIWVNDAGDIHLYNGTVSANAGDLTLAPSAVITGQTGDWDVCGQDATYAYFVGRAEGAVDNGALFKVNVLAFTKASVSFANAMQSGAAVFCSVQHLNVATVDCVAVIFCSQDAVTVTYGLYNSSLTQLWAPKTITTSTKLGRVACKFLLAPNGGLSYVVYACTANVSVDGFSELTASQTLGVRTEMWMEPLSGGTTIDLETLHWMSLQNSGAQFRISSTETYPLFFLGRCYYGTGLVNPFSADYVPDQSVEAYLIGNGYADGEQGTHLVIATPVARFGSVRGNLSPAKTWMSSDDDYMPGSPIPMIGSELFVPYRKDSLSTQLTYSGAYAGRYVRISLTPEQPSVAVDKDGDALVAAALPVQWDGAETVELGGPLHIPRLAVSNDGVSGGNPPYDAGVYAWVAMYQWTDGAGLVHRSAPSNIAATDAFPGAESDLWPCVRVTLPDSIRNGDEQLPVDVLLFQSTTDGTSYHLVTAQPSYEDGVAIWDTLPMVDGDEPTIYSLGTLGEEITPQPPPPLKDIVIVGQRCWGLDAEVSTRLVYSKLRVPGVGYEFFPAGEVHVPSGAGNIVAIREWVGSLVIFAERGIFQISDIGPNNQIGGQGGFGQPAKLSDVGCRTRLSVLSTPVGIMFQNNRKGFSLFAGGAPQSLPGAEIDADVVGSFLLEAADEACFVVSDDVRVFNYALQRWTLWDLPAAPTLVAGSALSRDSALLYAQSTGSLYVIASNTLSSTAVMTWETDWILLGGDFQDYIALHSVIFNGRSDSDHGITIELLTNYESTSSTSQSWTASEINAVKNAVGRYSIRVEPVRQDTRAVKVRITEVGNTGNNQGCRPGALTITFSVEGIVHEEAFNDACQK
jgi:hypothetical protein